jgi:hypothetical protein
LKELKRITEQNQALLSRIKSSEPVFDTAKLADQEEQRQKHMENMKSRSALTVYPDILIISHGGWVGFMLIM